MQVGELVGWCVFVGCPYGSYLSARCSSLHLSDRVLVSLVFDQGALFGCPYGSYPSARSSLLHLSDWVLASRSLTEMPLCSV